MSRLIKDKTVMIIAHRMRTVANADKIVVLKDGVVAESGTPSELDAKDGIYANMVKTQNLAADFCGYGVEDEDEGCPHCWIKKKI